MIWVYKYNDEFIWQAGEEILFDEEFDEEIPDWYTDIQPPDGLYIAKYDPDKKEWYESATQEYIDSFHSKQQQQPSEMEIMQKEIAELYYLLAVGEAS
ncbi:hypothetical protein ACQCU3_05815 [Bacillus altitudinis]|uniref:hypothetical protein n=1 Tax=Bacillus altitudinis TaxID=293387 RepID=UPI0011E96D92|nr:hypothetical protein [Bacillus altitudinis]TYS28423.1 hypothetical protein FZC69_08995 [Bacillus altitudinis]